MVTEEMLTLPAVSTLVPPRKPVPGFAQFVNAVLTLTDTQYQDWSFNGQEGTQAVAKGHFHGLYLGNQSGWNGFKFKFSLSSGVFSINGKGQFDTTAAGLIWWFKNGVHHKGSIPSEYLVAGESKSVPYKKGVLSKPARESLTALINMQN